jgi:hypothetical protein
VNEIRNRTDGIDDAVVDRRYARRPRMPRISLAERTLDKLTSLWFNDVGGIMVMVLHVVVLGFAGAVSGAIAFAGVYSIAFGLDHIFKTRLFK